MTDAELQRLRGEYVVEYGMVTAWLLHGFPYNGTWIPELVGKVPPAHDSPEWQKLYSLLQPGYLWDLFEQRVLGQHPEYPDFVVDEATGKKRSEELAEQMAQRRAELLALLGG